MNSKGNKKQSYFLPETLLHVWYLDLNISFTATPSPTTKGSHPCLPPPRVPTPTIQGSHSCHPPPRVPTSTTHHPPLKVPTPITHNPELSLLYPSPPPRVPTALRVHPRICHPRLPIPGGMSPSHSRNGLYCFHCLVQVLIFISF